MSELKVYNTLTDQLWHANNYKQFLKRIDGGKIPSITPTGIPGFMAGYDELCGRMTAKILNGLLRMETKIEFHRFASQFACHAYILSNYFLGKQNSIFPQ